MLYTLKFLMLYSVISSIRSQTNTCQNDGFPLPNSTCSCPSFVSGKTCETVNCQNMGILDGSQCACPPGAYSIACEMRGFRPAIDNVLDASTRTLVIVFSQRSSMKQYFPIFLEQLNTTVSILTKDGGLFDRFIFVGFIRHYDGTSSFSIIYMLTYANFYGFLKNIDFFDGDIVQPAMAAIERAQQLFPLGFSLVWVFTDTPDSDATAESLSFVDNNLEQRIIQIGLAWRSKLSLVVLQNDSSPIKSDGDKFDVYRRITRATHGDLIVCNSTELSNVIAIFALHAMPENLAVFYGITNKRNITFIPQRDFENQHVWVLVTLDINSGPKLPYYFNGKGIIVAPAAFGNFFVLYLSSESGPNRLESLDGTIFNARVFASSHQTTLFSFVQDELADFGYFYMQSDMPQTAVASPIGFPSLPIGMSYRLLTQSGNILSNYLHASKRDPETTTFPFVFEPITDCPPGPLSIDLTIILSTGQNIGRILPAFCSRSVAPPKSTELIESSVQNHNELKNKIDLEAATISCPKQNLAALGDPRLHSFRQLIFIFEQSKQIEEFASIMGGTMYQIVQSVNSSIQNVQYSLLSFDSDNVRVLMSTYDGDFFQRTFCSVITNLTFYPNSSGRPLRVQDAVDSAIKISILSPAIIHLFSYRSSYNALPKRFYGLIPKDVQLNFYSAYPTTELIRSISQANEELLYLQRQSSGRYRPIRTEATPTLFRASADDMLATQLIYDYRVKGCSGSGYSFNFYVENEATQLVFDMFGFNTSRIFLDGNNDPVNSTFRATYFSLESTQYVIPTDGTTAGKWTVIIKSASDYECGLQVRAITPYSLISGFVSDPSNDFPASQVFSSRGTNSSTRMVFRLSDSRQPASSSSSMQLSSISVLGTSVEQQFNESENLSTQVILSQRDGGSCTYQYISDVFQMTSQPLLKVILRGSDPLSNSILQRTFYYRITERNSPPYCNGNQVNPFGECLCPTNYTGELCDQKVCQNGGTPPNGICICDIGYIGPFCENVVVPSNTTFSTWVPPNSFPTAPSVTPEHTTPSVTPEHTTPSVTPEHTTSSGSQMIIPSVTLLYGCIILTSIHNFIMFW